MAKKTITSSPRSTPDWQRTYLWKTLEKRAGERGNIHANEMLPTLRIWMGQLDAVLRHGGSSPLDFTLHNDQHAFRVAERIAKLLTDSTRRNISDYELALLLLAAYGHDIGMTPQRQQVARHHRHLFHPEASQLSAAEQKQFQEFIDNFPARAVTLPLTSSIDDLNLADELTTYYVRDRHNDWSGDWLREHLTGSLAFLPDTVTVLIRLCQSHHWGFDRLASSDFDPLLSAGPQPQLIHLRYLASLLRLADILENDPERTPEVIFRHRSIQDRPKSLTHWIKDHHFTIDEQQNQLVIVATPPDARTHHAIEQLADWIDHELRGIAAFGERLPVEYKVGRETIRRDWPLAPALIRRIQPQPGTYRYIDGAFRPNTQRLLQLLSNEQLYGKPIVAVRELLQNAFDAVREKIARRRLEPHITDKADRKWEALLGDQEKVTLTLRRVTEIIDGKEQIHHQLICDDTGVGLTDKLITGHLLVSGQSRRHDILELERQCKEAGFSLGRTGQFGIGVLSYFMLAKEVHLTTTRYQGCRDADNQSWHFHTHGLSDFGELRPAKTTPFPTGGTRVEWHLRPDRISDEQEFVKDLSQYLIDTLVRIPCQFEFKVEGFPETMEGWQRNTGWTRTLEEWRDWIIEYWPASEAKFNSEEFLLSKDEISSQRSQRAIYAAALEEASTCLLLEETDVALPNGLGWARLILPYFALPNGRSLLWPILDDQGHPAIHSFDGINVGHKSYTAWKGMDCQIELPPRPDDEYEDKEDWSFQLDAFITEWDIQDVDKDTLAVSRSSLVLAREITSVLEDIVKRAANAFADDVLSCPKSQYYRELNLALQDRRLFLGESSAWFITNPKRTLRPLTSPMALLLGNEPKKNSCLASTGEEVQWIASNTSWLQYSSHEAAFPAPQRVCAFNAKASKGEPMNFALFWDTRLKSVTPRPITAFPKEWRDLALVYRNARCVAWQAEHPLVKMLSDEDRHVLLGSYHHHFSRPWKDVEILETPRDIAAYLLGLATDLLREDKVKSWNQFQANQADKINRLWQTAATVSGCRVADLAVVVAAHKYILHLSPTGMTSWKPNSADPNPLPKVTDPEFLLVPSKA